jgi:DNA-binding NarL/FixJ family response regulator
MKLSKLTKPELDEIFRNANFTEEEEQVFKMLSCGKTITETAQKINVCDRTVNRISKMLNKIFLNISISSPLLNFSLHD